MEICTVGFTKRSAADFFGALETAGVERVIDVRLNNRSQLAGFTKASDFPFLLERILGADYHHELLLAPEAEMLKAYRARELPWGSYEAEYLDLLRARDVGSTLDRELFEARSVLLCSEPGPGRCHRRLAAEYLQSCWGDIEIRHL
jgi:uncharacterized protein (DUF488 family)